MICPEVGTPVFDHHCLNNFLDKHQDTLLNVFLAIAVDNLANAQVLTKDEEEELRRAEEQKRLLNIMFSPIVDNRKQSKWTKVRSVPKMLMFTKQKDHEENPFKGITYKGRPPNLLRFYHCLFIYFLFLFLLIVSNTTFKKIM